MSGRKIVASVPAAQFEAVERMCRRLGLSRSRAVQEALALWLAARERDQRVRAYLHGYTAYPEDSREGPAYVRSWAQGLGPEEW